jgi:hypothetical protein
MSGLVVTSEARPPRLVAVTFMVTTVLYVIGVAFVIANAVAGAGSVPGPIAFDLITFAFSVSGILIARHQPGNPITWILLGIGFSFGLSAALDGYAQAALVAHPGSLPGGIGAVVLGSWLWVPGIVPMGTFLLLLFPDGRLPSRRWRVVAWASAASLVAAVLAILLQPGSLADDGFPNLTNPIGLPALAPVANVLYASIVTIPLCVVASAAALVIRFRRSTGVERLQLKWLAAAAATLAVTYGTAMIASIPVPWLQSSTPTPILVLQIIPIGCFVLIPLSIGVAILRYRLYDIDRLISRTLAYVLLTALLVGVYAAIVVGLGAATGRTDSPILIAGATLAVAALFRPARRGIQAVIDRRLYRRRYDAEMVLGSFASRLRDEVDLDTLSAELRTAAGRAVQPASVGVWIRGPGGLA